MVWDLLRYGIFCNVAHLKMSFGDLDTEMKRVAEPRGVYFLSLSFIPSFFSFRRRCCGAALVVSLRYGRQECNAQALKYHSEACEEISYCHGCQALATTDARQVRRSYRPRESGGFETPGVSVQGIRI